MLEALGLALQLAGLALLALAPRRQWQRLMPQRQRPPGLVPLGLGLCALAAWPILAAEGPSFGPLVWGGLLMLAGVIVAAVLAPGQPRSRP